MAKFTLSYNGDDYEVDAPDEATALDAFAESMGISANGGGASSDTSQPQGPGFGDYVSEGASGLNEGIGDFLGLPVDLATMGINATTGGINSLFGTDIKPVEKPFLGSESINGLMGYTGSIKPAKSDTGLEMTRRFSREYGTSLIPAFGAASKLGTMVDAAKMLATEAWLTGGSATAAALAEQATDNPYLQFGAQLLGATTAGGLQKVARKAITPFAVSAERQAAADLLKSNGIDLTAGQVTGSKGLRYAESELGGGAAQAGVEKQSEQFTKAALARANINANRASPEVLKNSYDDLGQTFDDLSSRNQLVPDQQLGSELRTAVDDYRALAGSDAKPIVDNAVSDLVAAMRANGGTVPGTIYKTLRSRLGRAQRETGNPELKGALSDIIGSLDDAMERWIAKNNPDDLGAWQQVRRDYRNFLVIERAATGAGENAAMGLISPAALKNAEMGVAGKRKYAQGTGDFSDLSRAGIATMAPLPDSGTTSRLAARTVMGIPATVGAVAGNGVLPVLGAVGGAALGATVPWAVGRALLSKAGKAYLTNRLLPKGVGAAGQGAGVAAALLAGQTRKPPLEITVAGAAP